MGIVSWWFVPEEAWLSKRRVGRVLDVTEGKDVTGVEDEIEEEDATIVIDVPKGHRQA